MNFEDTEIQSSVPNPSRSHLRVIVLTDNRLPPPPANDPSPISLDKEAEFDPFEFTTNLPHDSHDDPKIAQLTRRVTMLEELVEALSKSDAANRLAGGLCHKKSQQAERKKNRRRFKELVRDNLCPHCQKVYGSETALKYHLKLKHNTNSNHAQVL